MTPWGGSPADAGPVPEDMSRRWKATATTTRAIPPSAASSPSATSKACKKRRTAERGSDADGQVADDLDPVGDAGADVVVEFGEEGDGAAIVLVDPAPLRL